MFHMTPRLKSSQCQVREEKPFISSNFNKAWVSNKYYDWLLIVLGEVPPLSNLQNEIYFSLDAEKSFPTEAYLISESGVSQDVKLTVAKRKPRVFFLSNTINLDNIPLNLLQSTDAIVRNSK